MKAITAAFDDVLQFATVLRHPLFSQQCRLSPVGNSAVLAGKCTRQQLYVPARRWYP